MKIGYDAKRLFTNFTGLGNYSRNLVNQYNQFYSENEISLFTPRIVHDPRTAPFLVNSSFQIIQPKRFNPLWRTTDIVKDIRSAGVDIFHGLSHELPIGISKLAIGKVVTIHDLIFRYYKNDNSWADRKIYNWKWKHGCHVADRIIAISQETKNDLIKYYNIQPEKIKVIYQSADPAFKEKPTEQQVQLIKQKYNLPLAYNLYVGSVISRKNLLSIIKAMILLKKEERLPLVIIGNGKEYKKKVLQEAHRAGIDELLIWLGDPEFADFPAIYKGAVMMIYPSFYEGFGLPVIEAMHAGIPVITSNQSSLKEAGGDAAMLIDPKNPQEIAEAILQLQHDLYGRQQMVERGYQHIKKFDPSVIVGEMHSVYMECS